MRILLLQVYDNSHKELYELTKRKTQNYCIINKIDYMGININDIIVHQKISGLQLDYLHPAWSKIWIFHHIVDYKSYDYIWVLDIDIVILNYNIDIRQYIPRFEKLEHIICSINGANGGSLLNTGSIIYNPHAINAVLQSLKFHFNEKTIDELNKPFWEQDFINQLYDKIPDRFTILGMNDINSYWYQPDPNQLLFHFMARSLDDKIQIAKKFVNN